MTAWIDTALEDMRIRGWAGSYATSYAPNEVKPYGRRAGGNQSSQYERASLVMGRYPNATAFGTGNPDFTAELSYMGSTALADLAARSWSEFLPWSQTYLGDPWGVNHTAGWINNTRVGIWDWQVWMKSASTGQWVLMSGPHDTWGGMAIAPDFSVEDYSGTYGDFRTESNGLQTTRLTYASPTYASYPYWAWHGWAGGVQSLNAPGKGIYGPYDVADVLVSAKMALFVHNTTVADDRDYARFVTALGLDWYTSPRITVYPGMGTSRHKLVTAKYPNFQYIVAHTMTESRLLGSNGYPSYFANLSDSGGGGGTPIETVPTRGNWFAKLTSSANTWTTWDGSGATAPVWTTTSLPAATVGQMTIVQVVATGSPAPTYSKVSGPTWASISSGGVLTYTPDAAGTESITLRASNGSTPDATLTITITSSAPAATVAITSPAPGAFLAGTAATYQWIATGSGTLTWSITGNPSWLTLSSGGLMSVDSSVAAQARVTISVTNGSTSDTVSVLVTVASESAPDTPTDGWTRIERDVQTWVQQ